MVQLLLAAGAALNAVDKNGPGPEVRAVGPERTSKSFGSLARHGGPAGRTPLHAAAFNGDGAVAEQLVEAGAAEDALDVKGPGPRRPLGFGAVWRRSKP